MDQGASKKRKLCQDEDNEEEKMEKFFALVQGIREARDRLMSSSDHATRKKDGWRKKRKIGEEKAQAKVWKPSFQHEDFMEEAGRLKTTSAVTLVDPSERKDVGEDNEESKEGLDLVDPSQRKDADEDNGDSKEGLDLKLSL